MRCKRTLVLLLSLAFSVGAALLFKAENSEARDVTELTAPRTVVWQDFLGVNAHWLWFTPTQYHSQIELLQALGLQWVRVDLHWALLESRAGSFDYTQLDPLVNSIQKARLHSEFYLVGSAPFQTTAPADTTTNPDQYPPRDPTVYAQRLADLAQRYPSVDIWQVWNEPNLPAFWQPVPDSRSYAQLLDASVDALRKVPSLRQTPIAVGGLAYMGELPWRLGNMLDQLSSLGAFTHVQVVAYHPYTLLPEGSTSDADFVATAKARNAKLRAQGAKAIWADEWGWSSYAGPVVEQPIIGIEGQADYLLRRLVLLSALDYDRVFIFALSDLDSRATVRDRSYGLIDINGSPKPAYIALQRFLTITGPRLEPVKPPSVAGAHSGLFSIAWIRNDKHHLWMLWSIRGNDDVALKSKGPVFLNDPLNGTRRALNSTQDGTFKIPVSTHLQIVEWP